MSHLLLIEDEEVIRRALKRFLERKHFRVTDVATIEAAQATPLQTFDVVLADLRLPGAPGTDIIESVAPTPVVVMTSHASVRSAVDVMQTGASDYIAKPFDHDELLLVLERAMLRDRLGIRVTALERDLAGLISSSRCVAGTSLEDLATSVAHSRSRASGSTSIRCFLHGPPGCGREGVARAVHAAGSRADGPLVVMDVAAGEHTGGSSSTADTEVPVLAALRAARQGTLVVRYPDLLDGARQQQLADSLAVDTTDLICIADRELDHLASGERLTATFAALFDADDVHRIAPLRDRPDDVIAHATRVVDVTAARCGRAAPALEKAACQWLRTRSWPGELLELEALLARAAARVTTNTLALADLAGISADTGSALSLEEYFRWFVEMHQGSLSETELASRLGISRKALWERRQRSALLRPTE